MTTLTRFSLALVILAGALVVATSADAPHVYAIRGGKIVTAAGATHDSGTLVIRNGVIDAVGAGVAVPPEARVIDGTGLTVYPGLIDMGNTTAVDAAAPNPPASFRTSDEAERFKRSVIFRPDYEAAAHVRADAPELARLAAAGITTVLSTPPGQVVKGRSALVNVTGPEDEPQIGDVGDYRRGLQVVRAPVALHVDMSGGGGARGEGYPASLLGVISFVRQGFIDAQHQRVANPRYHDPSLTALEPALDGKLPVAFEAVEAREILRALAMAKEFALTPVITGGREADRVAADLKARNARVIYSLNYPTRSRMLAPDADEPLSALRARAEAPKTPAALVKAGVPFAFASAGLRDSRDFIRNAARAVKEGLSADAAVRALTIDAARIAGADARTGSLEKGKIANILVTAGDLFDERMTIKHVFVDGRLVDVDDAPEPQQRGRGGRGSQ